MSRPRYTRASVGCYADGVLGHSHVRAQLADLVWRLTSSDDGIAEGPLVPSLLGPMPDDAWDELEALDILNDACEPGVHWEMVDGNLMLLTDEESDHE